MKKYLYFFIMQNMECVVCFEDASELHFRACCNHVICQQCLDDIIHEGGVCLCQQQIKLSSWESSPVCLQELGSKLLQQVQKADAWFWSTQHREFVDMPSWDDYLYASIKSLHDYVQFLDRVQYYQLHDKYPPPVHPWTFEVPGVMNYSQVYSDATYRWLVEDCLRQVQRMDYSSSTTIFKNLKVQTSKICITACKKNFYNLSYVKKPTYQLYNKVFIDRNEALPIASGHGHINVVKYIIKNGVSSPAKNRALEAASQFGHLDVVKYLLDHGADTINHALALASNHGQLDVVKLLLAYGSNIHSYNFALNWASLGGQLDVVKYLLDNGAVVDKETLIRAVINGHLETVKYLVQQGADIHALDDQALVHASQRGHLALVQYLIKQGANVHTDLALYWASKRGCLLDHS